MNWYQTLKVAFPHREEECPKCRRPFYIDLLWEHQGNSIGHHYVDRKGKNIPESVALQHPEQVEKEYSESSIECPFCSYQWSAIFEQCRDSADIEEITLHETPPSYLPKVLAVQ